jgi:uncharacterized protein YjbI with pentapeptide repeats
LTTLTKFQIKNRFTGAIIFEHEAENLRDAVIAAVKSRADLSDANLSRADLSDADLSGANLSRADLSDANLSRADLSDADLSGANLSYANLSRADLSDANLSGANLSDANLNKTILDPTNKPNTITDGFEDVAGQDSWVYGYRTRKTSAAGLMLQDDRIYGTEVFSTADTECHPGWYLWPTLAESKQFSYQCSEFIRVKARKIDIHKAGDKWRSRAIWVIGGAE